MVWLGRWDFRSREMEKVDFVGVQGLCCRADFAVHITMFFNGAIHMAYSPTKSCGVAVMLRRKKFPLHHVRQIYSPPGTPGALRIKGSWRIFCLWWAMFRWSPAIQHNVGLFMLFTPGWMILCQQRLREQFPLSCWMLILMAGWGCIELVLAPGRLCLDMMLQLAPGVCRSGKS